MISEEDTMRALPRLVVVALLYDLSFTSGVVDVHDLLFCIAWENIAQESEFYQILTLSILLTLYQLLEFFITSLTIKY